MTEVRESRTSGVGPGQRLKPEVVILGADQKALKSKAHLNKGFKTAYAFILPQLILQLFMNSIFFQSGGPSPDITYLSVTVFLPLDF